MISYTEWNTKKQTEVGSFTNIIYQNITLVYLELYFLEDTKIDILNKHKTSDTFISKALKMLEE